MVTNAKQTAFDFNMPAPPAVIHGIDIPPAVDPGDYVRDAKIQSSIIHAETVQAGWANDAFAILREFISRMDVEFMAENIRAYAEQTRSFTAPASPRAWGAVIMRAKRAGMIKCIGVRSVKNPNAHSANASIWISSNHPEWNKYGAVS